jgi:hypothetical protein
MKKRTPILYEGGMYMGKIYLANAFSANMLTGLLDETDVIVKFKKVSTSDVKDILTNNDFISVVGHETTANVLSTLLGMNIQTNRMNLRLNEGDVVIIFQLNQRLPEGSVLNEEELTKLDFTFILGTVSIE